MRWGLTKLPFCLLAWSVQLLHTCISVVAVFSFHLGSSNHTVQSVASCNAGYIFWISTKALPNLIITPSHYRLELYKTALVKIKSPVRSKSFLLAFFFIVFNLDSWTFRKTASSALKTGNKKNSLSSYPLPLPILCKEQICYMQAHCSECLIKASAGLCTCFESFMYYDCLQ